MALTRHYSASSPAMDRYGSVPRELRPEPFVKWVGGKKRMLEALDPFFPAHFETYHEPFLGGGAVFFFLRHVGRAHRAVLSDVNAELIQAYRVVRDEPDRLIAELGAYPYESEFYYAIRGRDPETLDPVARAARTLYLNRTCFNGLYRVNADGRFNVPFGRYENPIICNISNLKNASRALQGVEIQCWPFEVVLEVSHAGDFVYLDPPRQTLAATTRLAKGTPDAFSPAEQGRLYETFRLLDRRGCLVMISCPNLPIHRHMFQEYDLCELADPSTTKARGRRRRTELVVRNYC